MQKKTLLVLFLVLLLPPGVGLAQSEDTELRLHLRRTFGYQGGSTIQGSFSLEVSGVPGLAVVDYLLDGEVFASAEQAPFRISFSTGSFAPGEHVLQAVGVGEEGERFESQAIRVTFITAEDSWQVAGRIVAWILAGVVAIMLMGTFASGFLTRGKGRFMLGAYGAAGGAVCKRCQLPFSRHFLSPNLLLGKLERCPHCGYLWIVPRASPPDLEAAEARYRQDQKKGQRLVQEEQERLKHRLDESRFED